MTDKVLVDHLPSGEVDLSCLYIVTSGVLVGDGVLVGVSVGVKVGFAVSVTASMAVWVGVEVHDTKRIIKWTVRISRLC